MNDRTSVGAWHRAVTRLVLVLLGIGAISGALLGVGAGAAGADPATEKAKVSPGYQAVVEDEKSALCMGNEPNSDEDSGDEEESPSPSPSESPSDEEGTTGSEDICGDKTEDLWKAAAKCSKGKTAATKDDVDSEAKKDFIECMADEGFGEKDEEKDEQTTEQAEQMAKLTLGRVSASLTAFYVNELSPAAGGDEESSDDEESEGDSDSEGSTEGEQTSKPKAGLDGWGSVLAAPSMAGGFVGSLDRSKGESNEWLFGPGNSANTAEIKYSAFYRDLDPGGFLGSSESGTGVGVPTTKGDIPVPDGGTQGYLTYGAMLAGLGLDTAVNKDDGLSGLLNAPGPRGYVLLLAYMGTGFLDTLFDSVLEALQFLNPFRFMVDAITGEYGDGAKGELGDPVEGEPEGGFAGLQEAFGKIYSVLINIGWMLVVPILLITLGFAAVFLKQANTGGKAKKVIIVVVFLAAGLPIFGGLYTAALTSMASTNVGSAKSASTKIVLSTLVDFESWVTNSRLTPPVNAPLGWSMTENSPVAKSEANVRKFALEINSSNNASFAGIGGVNGFGQNTDGEDDDSRWSSSTMGTASGARAGAQAGTDAGSLGDSLSAFDATRDLLLRYAKSSPVTASGFESQVKSALISLNSSSTANGGKDVDKATVQKAVLAWFEQLSDPAALAKMTSEEVGKLNNPLIQVGSKGGSGLQALVGDNTWVFKGSNKANADGDQCRMGDSSGVVPPNWTPDAEDGSALLPCNLSIMAMYNYLNTSFGPTSMETFSPEQTMNAYSRTNHASVTAVGAGPAGLLYFFSALSVLGSFVVIGFGYALAMMFSTIKRGFHLMGSVLAASVGLISGVAKVAIYTAALLLEVLGTLFLYKLVQELILLVPSILEKPLASSLNTPGGALDALENANESTQVAVTAAGAGVAAQLSDGKSLGIAALLITLVSTIGVVVFTIMAMRLRRGLLDSIDQAVSNVINKFTETQVSSGMEPSKPGALRQGLGRGVSMGAQSMLMGSQMGGGGDETTGGDVGEADSTGADGTASGPGSADQVSAPSEGAPGTNGDGSMSVGKDGGMTDAAGNPVMSKAGTPMGLDSFVPIDSSSGHLMDAPGGNEVIGADGNPIDSGDIGGFDSNGTILGADGTPMKDVNGTELSSTAARQASGNLMGAEALAQRVQSQGGLSSMAINPMTGAPAATSAQQATIAPPEPSSGPKAIGETPSSEHAVGGGSAARHAAASIGAGMVASKISGQRQRRNYLGGSGPGSGGTPPKK